MKRRRWNLLRAVHSAMLNLAPEPELLWSKGIGAFCDFAGPRTYRLAPTETTQTEAFFLRHFRGAHGVVWVRLSTLSRDRRPCDLDTFARVVLPTIEAPFTLLTTDGDASAPSDFARETVERLLTSRFLVSWYTQNRDGDDPRIKPFPIGLDLHTPRLPATPAGLVKALKTIRARRTPAANAPLKVFCDLGINTNSTERRELLEVLRGCPHADVLGSRVSQRRIWELYAQYPLALSAVGNGMDCHRTWELLYLGSIVVALHSPLDPLYDDLPVLLLDDWRQLLDTELLSRAVEKLAPLTDRDHVWRRLRSETYLAAIRRELEQP